MAKTDHHALRAKAAQALEQAGTPLHYGVLADHMKLLGWSYQGKTEAGYAVYASLKHLIEKESQVNEDLAIPFTFLGKGIFGLVGMAEVDLSEVERAAPSRESGDAIARRERVQRSQLPRTCGYCAHGMFAGVHQATLSIAQCELDHKSNRPYNYSEDPGCEHWRPKGMATVRGDQQRQDNLLTIINAKNLELCRALRRANR